MKDRQTVRIYLGPFAEDGRYRPLDREGVKWLADQLCSESRVHSERTMSCGWIPYQAAYSFPALVDRIEELEAKNARFKEALEEIAEESDSGRHDGLPEPCPAHEDVVMWLRAREALKGTDDE